VALHSEIGTEEQICNSKEQRLGQWPGIFIIFISLKTRNVEEYCQPRVSTEHTVTSITQQEKIHPPRTSREASSYKRTIGRSTQAPASSRKKFAPGR